MTQLRRELSLFDLTMIAVGSTIGSGIFLTPSLIAHTLQAPVWILLAWICGGLMALSGALTLSELGAMMPEAGGIYVYLTRAYGSLAGFLFGWAYFLVVNTGGIAALGIAFATYLSYIIPLGSLGISVAAIVGIVILTAINVLGVKAGGIFSDIFTVLKLAGIAGLIVVGFGWGSPSTTDFAASAGAFPGGFSHAFSLAMVGVLWSIGGWQHATFTSAEAKNPQRNLPRAMILAAVIITFTYLLTVIALLFLMTPAQMGASAHPAADAVGYVLGSAGGVAIALAVFISTFGRTGIYTLTAPRIYYAMATDGFFFRRVAQLHPRYHTPALAIIVQSIWAIVLILFWGTFENLISYVVFTDWIFFAMAGAGVFVLRAKEPDAVRPYRTAGYPWTPLFFVAVSLWFVFNTFVSRPDQAWAGIGFLALGVPVYYLWSARRKKYQI
ncbi:amino acid permease [bacterium]|nr:MAG: amino acid permease [bacterium]